MLGNRWLNILFTYHYTYHISYCVILMTCVNQQTSQTNWAMAIKPDTHCPGIHAGPVDVVGPGCWMVNSGYHLAVMEASWTVERSERSCSEAAAFCGVHGSFETKPGKHTYMYDDLHMMWMCGERREIYSIANTVGQSLKAVQTWFVLLFICLCQRITVWCRACFNPFSPKRFKYVWFAHFRLFFLQNN